MARRPRSSPVRDVAPTPPAGAVAPPDFRAILESAADIIYTLDFSGRLTYLNARA